MASQTKDSFMDLLTTGKGPSRLIRISQISSTTKLCERGRERQEQPVYGRLQQDLGLPIGLDLSPSCTHTPGSTTSKNVQRPLSTSNAKMGESLLGQRYKESSCLLPIAHTGSEEQPNRPSNEPATTGSRPAQFSGLEGTGWTNQLTGWNESEKNILVFLENINNENL